MRLNQLLLFFCLLNVHLAFGSDVHANANLLEKDPEVIVVDRREDNVHELTDESKKLLQSGNPNHTVTVYANAKFLVRKGEFTGTETVPVRILLVRPEKGVEIPPEYIKRVIDEMRRAVASSRNEDWKETPYPQAFLSDGLGPLNSRPIQKSQWSSAQWQPEWDKPFIDIISQLEKTPTDRQLLSRAMDFFCRMEKSSRAVPFIERFLAAGGQLYSRGHEHLIVGLALIGRFKDARERFLDARKTCRGQKETENAGCELFFRWLGYAHDTGDTMLCARLLIDAQELRLKRQPGSIEFEDLFCKEIAAGQASTILPRLDQVWMALPSKSVKHCRDQLLSSGLKPTDAMLAACNPLNQDRPAASIVYVWRSQDWISLDYWDPDAEQALAFAQKAVAVARLEHSRESLFDALENLAQCAHNYDALEIESDAATELEAIGADLGGGCACISKMRLASLQEHLADFRSATQSYRDAVQLSQQCRDDARRWDATNAYLGAASRLGAASGVEQELRKRADWFERTGAHAGWENFSLAICLRQQGRYSEAIDCLKCAKSVLIDSNSFRVHIALGQLYLLTGKPDLALAEFDQLAAKYEKTKSHIDEWMLYLGRAQACRQNNDLSAAGAWISECLNRIESARASLKDYHRRRTLLDNKLEAYELAVELALASGDEARAFELTERSRSRTFIDALGAHASKTYSIPITNLKQIQSKCDGYTCVIFYQLKDRLLAWIINSTNLELVTLPLSAQHVQALVTEGCRAVHPDRHSNRGTTEWKVALKQLHDELWKPIAAKLGHDARVCLVPHQMLHYVPFQALYDGDKFLIEQHELFCSPSGSALVALSDHRVSNNSFVAVLDPILSKDPTSPFAATETAAIQRIFPKATVFLQEKATVECFKQVAPEAGIIHVSSHGSYDPSIPLRSGLHLFPKDDADAAVVRAQDVYEMHFTDCQLIVMSACVSSVGELAGGDEVTGLTRAFQAAGVPNVIGSLWPVDNAATTSLMTAFYEELKKDLRDPVKALCTAQRRTLKTLEHPNLWAAFEVSGIGLVRPPQGK